MGSGRRREPCCMSAWCFSPDVIEAQLAHSVRDSLGRAYNRTELVEQRRMMLQAWANYLDQLRLGEVVARRNKVKQAGFERLQGT